ncbi:hypothetical protein PHYSODRAFT_286290 [Phytophthora sojae]|uniref:RxLR effector protein n=2 Tax=Phytophthora sojae TaxID=67593 RepID=G4ZL30_PHYSP|nr:hypothetical protein PHYSODRAFT_286290 [Phytophthora sojae]AEK80784.1 Avh159 [Phytophthora sojae]AEK80785.1 Avh159 [Phytophthora sojae]AEK80786.1 Avh159 [Phytophthora sojae]EGZ15252.1 hypothetical protein PHYSODRAFT_286290 [Phytophthora sojae]|eukprot:XP_009529001.1 hypothetical protein PHYSODRAFT_286290 [Phytophthora sojae]
MARVRWVLLLAVAAVLTNASAYFVTESKLSLNSEPSDIHFNRLLRVVDGEERGRLGGVAVPFLEKAKTVLLPAVSTAKLSQWVTKGKPVNEVFVRLGLKKVVLEKLFETPQFFSWAKYVDDLGKQAPAKAPTMIPTLVTQYGDDALATSLEVSLHGATRPILHLGD